MALELAGRSSLDILWRRGTASGPRPDYEARGACRLRIDSRATPEAERGRVSRGARSRMVGAKLARTISEPNGERMRRCRRCGEGVSL